MGKDSVRTLPHFNVPVLQSCGCTTEGATFHDKVIKAPALDEVNCDACGTAVVPWAVVNRALVVPEAGIHRGRQSFDETVRTLPKRGYFQIQENYYRLPTDETMAKAQLRHLTTDLRRACDVKTIRSLLTKRVAVHEYLGGTHAAASDVQRMAALGSATHASSVNPYARSAQSSAETPTPGGTGRWELDPITCQEMYQPATTLCGHTFDRHTLVGHELDLCPLCTVPLGKYFFDNKAIEERCSPTPPEDYEGLPFKLHASTPLPPLKYDLYELTAGRHFKTAQQELQADHDAEALSALDEALAYNPCHHEARLQRAELRLRMQQSMPALYDYRDYCVAHPHAKEIVAKTAQLAQDLRANDIVWELITQEGADSSAISMDVCCAALQGRLQAEGLWTQKLADAAYLANRCEQRIPDVLQKLLLTLADDSRTRSFPGGDPDGAAHIDFLYALLDAGCFDQASDLKAVWAGNLTELPGFPLLNARILIESIPETATLEHAEIVQDAYNQLMGVESAPWDPREVKRFAACRALVIKQTVVLFFNGFGHDFVPDRARLPRLGRFVAEMKAIHQDDALDFMALALDCENGANFGLATDLAAVAESLARLEGGVGRSGRLKSLSTRAAKALDDAKKKLKITSTPPLLRTAVRPVYIKATVLAMLCVIFVLLQENLEQKSKTAE